MRQPPSKSLIVAIKITHLSTGDEADVCGICRVHYEQSPPDVKFPGDDAPVVRPSSVSLVLASTIQGPIKQHIDALFNDLIPVNLFAWM